MSNSSQSQISDYFKHSKTSMFKLNKQKQLKNKYKLLDSLENNMIVFSDDEDENQCSQKSSSVSVTFEKETVSRTSVVSTEYDSDSESSVFSCLTRLSCVSKLSSQSNRSTKKRGSKNDKLSRKKITKVTTSSKRNSAKENLSNNISVLKRSARDLFESEFLSTDLLTDVEVTYENYNQEQIKVNESPSTKPLINVIYNEIIKHPAASKNINVSIGNNDVENGQTKSCTQNSTLQQRVSTNESQEIEPSDIVSTDESHAPESNSTDENHATETENVNNLNSNSVAIRNNEIKNTSIKFFRTQQSVSANESSDIEFSDDERPIVAKNVSIQTNLNQSVSAAETSTSVLIVNKSPLKRKLNMATQTSSNDIQEEVFVSPTKRLYITPEKSITKKIAILKLSSTTKKILNSSERRLQSLKSPMKQLTLKDMDFSSKVVKNLGKLESPIKGKEKIAKDKKESRYTAETHTRVYENLRKIVQWVFENDHFSMLFTKREMDLLKKLFEISNKYYVVLCIRLYTRQSKWYNLTNLACELKFGTDDFHFNEALTFLSSDFADTDYSHEKTELLLDYLTTPDIKDICNSFKLKGPSTKPNMISKLLRHSTQQSTLTSLKNTEQILRERIRSKLGICVKLKQSVRDLFYRIHLLYSLTNPDLETANDIYNLMNKIQNKVVVYPKVTVESTNIFTNRYDFIKYSEARILQNEFNEAVLKKKLHDQYLLCTEAYKRFLETLKDTEQVKYDKSKLLFLRRFSAAWVYCKVLSEGSQKLTKHNSVEVCNWLTDMLKQNIYCNYKRGKWYTQLSIVKKTHLKDVSAAVECLLDGLSDKYVTEVFKNDISIRGSKFIKRNLSQILFDRLQQSLLPKFDPPVSRTIQASIVHNNEPGRKLQFVRNTSQGKEYSSVEETAITYYTTKDIYTQGVHCEGRLLTAIFFIVFWDVIYKTHVPNTFITEIQQYPLDLYTEDFYKNRSGEIKARLNDIRNNWTLDLLCQFISKIFHLHSRELLSVIGGDVFGDERMFHIYVRCIGRKLLAAILERLATDYRQFNSGLPDLFLWNHEELKCCFVEVKSERDTLSTNQILWIHYLNHFGAKVEVCHVQNIGSRIKKNAQKSKTNEKN